MSGSEHQCFTVQSTSYLRNLSKDDLKDECVAIHYQRPPVKHDDGRTSLSLNFPLLIMSFYASEQEVVAQRVADILNKHWDDQP